MLNPLPSPQGSRGGSRASRPDRFERFTSSGEVGVRLDAANRAILTLVEQYRLMNTTQIQAALQRHSDPDVRKVGAVLRTLRSRLHSLFHSREKHLTRPASQLNLWWTKGKPTLPSVYGLGPGGYAALHPAEANAQSKSVIDLRDKRIGPGYIDHRLKTTTALLCFAHAAEAEGFAAEFSEGDDFREATGLPRYINVQDGQRARALPLNPDSHIVVTDPDNVPAPMHFFLEIDNGTEPIKRLGPKRWEWTSIHRKLLVFNQIAPRKRDNDVIRQLRAPFPFRVLIVTTSPARMDSMRAIARELDPKGKGARLFLFTSQGFVTLERPEDVLVEPIWWSPNDDDQPITLLASPPTSTQLTPSA